MQAMRARGDRGPDIPAGMRPGPSDDVLERRHLEKAMGWGIVFVAITALWLPWLWLREPAQNVDESLELISRSTDRGATWFQEASEENPTGFGCARCHGVEAQGGSVPFTSETGEFNPAYPVPPLLDVCGRLPITDTDPAATSIQETIMQGRPGTPMPSWSVRFAGPMNDQQIQDLIRYLIEINSENVPEEDNLCVNPSAGATEEEPATGSSPDAPPGAPAEEG